MATTNVYLTFNGNCEEAFLFYKEVFEREFTYIGKFKDMPANDECEVDPEIAEKIMHVCLPISTETMLMGSDATEQSGEVVFGNNFAISINAESKEDADTYFLKLSKNGTIQMPMQHTFWGAYFGMFTDKFGINWMVNFDEEEGV
ncbi:VOC family protein [Neptunitalea lumnitzerae]|uniref:VOC family protein n=1 Tax=Neptunitalea lumnitzerae TaxID=2965509 RepID=A0ABQ5ML65_9FLAO|nr:VOC family protein [Neptunitalea sp. Y10]GLB50160.1 VOC family protein [Neptunitalea sp. Y10]